MKGYKASELGEGCEMTHIDFYMILNKMICLVNEKALPNVYEGIISEIREINDLKSNQAIILSQFKSKKLERMEKLITLVQTEYEGNRNFLEIYDLLDLFEFLIAISKSFNLKFNDNQIVKYSVKFKQISKFIENADQWINSGKLDKWVESSNSHQLLTDLLLTGPTLENIDYWIRIEAFKFISSIYKEIESLSISDLNFNPYLIILFGFKTLEEAITVPYEQTISRKLSGKWGLVGENILRHFYAVRSELREFDLKKFVHDKEHDNYIPYHYEIKSMPAGTMRGAEEKKFFEIVMPNYQRKSGYSNMGFMLGGLYQSKRAKSLDNKVQRMVNQNPDIKFISFPRVVIGGQQLWFEFSNDDDFFSRLTFHFNQVAELISSHYGKGSILDLITFKKEKLLEELKQKYTNLDSIINDNL